MPSARLLQVPFYNWKTKTPRGQKKSTGNNVMQSLLNLKYEEMKNCLACISYLAVPKSMVPRETASNIKGGVPHYT